MNWKEVVLVNDRCMSMLRNHSESSIAASKLNGNRIEITAHRRHNIRHQRTVLWLVSYSLFDDPQWFGWSKRCLNGVLRVAGLGYKLLLAS